MYVEQFPLQYQGVAKANIELHFPFPPQMMTMKRYCVSWPVSRLMREVTPRLGSTAHGYGEFEPWNLFSHMHTLTACTSTCPMHTPPSHTSHTLTMCTCARHTCICTRPHTPHPTHLHTPCIMHTLAYPSHVHPPTSGVRHEVGVGKEHATTMQKSKVLVPLLFYVVHECVRACVRRLHRHHL